MIENIKNKVDYAYGLLNQKEVIYFQGQTWEHKKEVTEADIEDVKNILSQVYKELDGLQQNLKELV